MQLGRGLDPKIVQFPVMAGAAAKLDSGALAALLDSRVRTLQVVCGAMLGSAAMLAGASVVAVRSMTLPPATANGSLSLALTVVAVVIILAASRLHIAILARAGRINAAVLGAQAAASAALDAFGRATVVSYVLLDATAALGLVIAVFTGTVRYSLVLCAAATLAMLVRWPRRQAVLALLRRRGLA